MVSEACTVSNTENVHLIDPIASTNATPEAASSVGEVGVVPNVALDQDSSTVAALTLEQCVEFQVLDAQRRGTAITPEKLVRGAIAMLPRLIVRPNIENASDELDSKRLEEANLRAYEKYGDKVRVFRIIDASTVDIAGRQIALSRPRESFVTRRARQCLIAKLVDSRGTLLRARDITKTISLDDVASTLKVLQVHLEDKNGKSVIRVVKDRPTLSGYAFEDDVVVIDERRVDGESAVQINSPTKTEDSQGLATIVTRPAAAEVTKAARLLHSQLRRELSQLQHEHPEDNEQLEDLNRRIITFARNLPIDTEYTGGASRVLANLRESCFELMRDRNQGLLYFVLKPFFSKHPNRKDELYAAALFGLHKAADGFDLMSGNRFSTYAVHTIRGNVLNFLRDDRMSTTILPRAVVERHMAINKLEGMGKSYEEIAKTLGISMPEIQETKELINRYYANESYDTIIEESGDSRVPSDVGTISFEVSERGSELLLLFEGMVLDERELILLEELFAVVKYRDGSFGFRPETWNKKSQSGIGEILGHSQAHIGRLQNQLIEKIKAALGVAST